MTITTSNRDMLVRRDAEGREEFVAWGERVETRDDRKSLVWQFEATAPGYMWRASLPMQDYAVIPRDRIEVTDDVADLGPGWRARFEHDGIMSETTIVPRNGPNGIVRLPSKSHLLSAWRVLPEPPSEVEALAESFWASVDERGIRGRLYRDDCTYLAEHMHALGYRKTEDTGRTQ